MFPSLFSLFFSKNSHFPAFNSHIKLAKQLLGAVDGGVLKDVAVVDVHDLKGDDMSAFIGTASGALKCGRVA